MSERQRNLFDTVGGQGAYYQPRDVRPLAATADPETSHEAAERIRESVPQQAARVAEWVRRYPGRTSLELAAICGDPTLDRHTFGRRLPDAEDLGLVRRGEPRVCSASTKHMRALTWFPNGQA